MDYPSDALVAPISWRFWARLIDCSVLLLLLIIANSASFLPTVLAEIWRWGFVLVLIVYYFCSDAMPNGQSVGKLTLGIRVLDGVTGKACSVGQGIARSLFLYYIFPFEFFALATDGAQRFGDRLANTYVVRVHQLPPPLPGPPLRPTHIRLQPRTEADKPTG